MRSFTVTRFDGGKIGCSVLDWEVRVASDVKMEDPVDMSQK
jgi:hypothetical protein